MKKPGTQMYDSLVIALQKALVELEYAQEHMGFDRLMPRAMTIGEIKAVLSSLQPEERE